MGKEDLLGKSRLLTDEYAVKILTATVRTPRSAQQISAQFGIPIAACYRRIRDLEVAGLIRCTERRLSRQGKRVCFYQSRIRTAALQYENGRLKVRFTMLDETQNSDWQDVDLHEDRNDGDGR
ncbi:MAG TPA: winged helix-turn-helix domain-containing protein [Methanomassiliicoccales archaeon]|nr:winged helix-turn-helix domain-containing protein [Methanomassiliicoccales archaeon]HPR99112.1 winged helix-turn-helix domain-containing protein [Methanomassiliicoccales archaeon]